RLASRGWSFSHWVAWKRPVPKRAWCLSKTDNTRNQKAAPGTKPGAAFLYPGSDPEYIWWVKMYRGSDPHGRSWVGGSSRRWGTWSVLVVRHLRILCLRLLSGYMTRIRS